MYTVLETIRKCIDESPCISFEEYFNAYVCDMQDKILDSEIHTLQRDNLLDSNLVIALTNSDQEMLSWLANQI